LNVMQRHTELLTNPAMKEIYQLISQNIHNENNSYQQTLNAKR